MEFAPPGLGVSAEGSAGLPLLPMFFRNPMDQENRVKVANIRQFRGRANRQGTIDIYWLYDDGGTIVFLNSLN